jgi:hypothetical protein
MQSDAVDRPPSPVPNPLGTHPYVGHCLLLIPTHPFYVRMSHSGGIDTDYQTRTSRVDSKGISAFGDSRLEVTSPHR